MVDRSGKICKSERNFGKLTQKYQIVDIFLNKSVNAHNLSRYLLIGFGEKEFYHNFKKYTHLFPVVQSV